ncbi:MOSC domain-containing protein [Deinococcus aerolatus]|uniref:MOSC domain-containing protein n=1 Tax=Deinococcus aerolatus TaxID=522487 RepID=A0ABQ2G408_9DEIO|nr:MOSC domain-containing protein [Deinococcus aerolatus]GGL74467.1 MOSC domain-containing protein [Deinococcus aerolatus]
MKLLGVCVGTPQAVRSKSGWTGIHKRPVAGAVFIGRLGLSGDHILDTENHGGPDQAVYIYTGPDYRFWSARLGRQLAPGTFGENLLFSDLQSASVRLGQQFRVGSALLEVTFARIPCVTLAERMGDPGFVRRFRDAGRPGMYARVLQEGEVRAGDPVTPVGSVLTDAPTVLDNFEAFFSGQEPLSPG